MGKCVVTFKLWLLFDRVGSRSEHGHDLGMLDAVSLAVGAKRLLVVQRVVRG